MAFRGGGGKRQGRRYNDVRLEDIDYKNEKLLQRFLTDTGRIYPRRQTGVTALMQRRVTTAIKRARHLALLPYSER